MFNTVCVYFLPLFISSSLLPPIHCNLLGTFVAVLQETATLSAEDAATRAAEQLALLRTAKAAAGEAAAAPPPQEESQEDEPSALRGVSGNVASQVLQVSWQDLARKGPEGQ